MRGHINLKNCNRNCIIFHITQGVAIIVDSFWGFGNAINILHSEPPTVNYKLLPIIINFFSLIIIRQGYMPVLLMLLHSKRYIRES
jgi:hypothetical protein